jgi:DNA-binding transcriptional MerR regulator
MYTTGDLAKLFAPRTAQTIKNWSDEFQRHLSITANPETGAKRLFNDDDVKVFALVHEMKNEGRRYEDIHLALDIGQRGIPPEPPQGLTVTDDQKQITKLQSALATAYEHIKALEIELKSANTRADRAEGAQEALKQQLVEVQERFIQLRIKMSELEKSESKIGGL